MKKTIKQIENLLRCNILFEVQVALKTVRSLVATKLNNKNLLKDKGVYLKVYNSLLDLMVLTKDSISEV